MDSGEGTKSKTQTRRKRKAIAVEQESPSADNFFAENKKMAGFDNPGESLYTTVRVLVENALDSAESIRQLPSVEVTIEEIPGSLETGKASQKKALGKKVKAAKGIKGGFYRVTCKDNGRGMTGGDIHKMFGRVLCGTNDGAKQTRGGSGLGTKMAFLWAKMSTGEPVELSTSKKNQNRTTFCILDMDIDTNVPDIQILEKLGGKVKWHGAEFKVVIEGDWTKYGLKISEYMRRTALITPYAEFTYRFVADTRGKEDGEYLMFPRRTNVMPPETKYFASAVNVCMMERLIAETPKQKTLLQFIKDEFVDTGRPDAIKLLFEKMGVTDKTKVGSLKSEQLACMLEFFQQDDPSKCLSPVGADNLRLGIIEQLEAESVATYSTRGGMLEGHPFILEVGVCVEGEDMEQGITVFRFANRVPLLFDEEEEDFVTSAVNEIDWKRYMINREENRVGVFVSIVSTKLDPFKGTGVDQAHMVCLVRAGLESCCLELEGGLRRNVDGVATCVYNMVGILRKMKNVKMSKEIAELAKEIEAGNVTLESYKEKLRLRV